MNLTIQVIKNASSELRSELKEFSDSNWGDSSESTSETLLNFFLPFDVAILAKDGEIKVGLIEIFFKKNIVFEKGNINIGGIGGVVVDKNYRHKGVATKMLVKSLEILGNEGFDIAMLCADMEKLGGLYGLVGFVPLGRKYIFLDKNGKLKECLGGMAAPVASIDVFNSIVSSHSIINVGKSNF